MRQAFRADFTVVKVTEDTVFIVDNAEISQSMSITNDAENVVSYLNTLYPSKRIVYRDTTGKWDALSHVNGEFKGFREWKGDPPL